MKTFTGVLAAGRGCGHAGEFARVPAAPGVELRGLPAAFPEREAGLSLCVLADINCPDLRRLLRD
jgi:hypothetical protein